MNLPNIEIVDAPEWTIARQAVKDKLDNAAAFRECRTVEVFTDGSAPISNPGGQAGFGIVAVGYAEAVDTEKAARPQPCAQLSVGGYIPARRDEPATSNNRAEIAGTLAAFELARCLGEKYARLEQVCVWSDSKYVVNCGNGVWQRKKNTDLWAAFDAVLAQVKGELTLGWVKGHAASNLNNTADELATLAAFNFDEVVHKRFRAAQQATGREIIGSFQVVETLGASLGNISSAEESADLIDEWQPNNDYTLVLFTEMDGGGYAGAGSGSGPCTGTYRLTSRDGRNYKTKVKHKGKRIPDEGEYMTLMAALNDLITRIEAAGRNPGNYTLAIVSRRELMTKQLTGAYRVKSPLLQSLYVEVRDLLKQFKHVEISWRRNGLSAQALD